MTNNNESGNDPQEVLCDHEKDCERKAVVFTPYYKHNCCAQHGKEWGLE